MNLADSDFALFALPERFCQDRAEVDARWRQLQREAHPDRFATQGAAAQRLAMQWSVRINEAHQRLKDPLRRAAYLCELRGAPINAESNTTMPSEFLIEQMQWREALDEAQCAADFNSLAAQLQAARAHWMAAIEDSLDQRGDALAAAQQVRALMFIERFGQDVQSRLDRSGF